MSQVLADNQIWFRSIITCKIHSTEEEIIIFSLLDYLVFLDKCSSDYLVLFQVIFLLKLISLLSKSVLLTKLACFNLATVFSAVNFLSS